MDFPLPFSGIRLFIDFSSRDDLLDFLLWVGEGCRMAHDHNIAVAFDGNRIFGSELLGDCYQKWDECRLGRGITAADPSSSPAG